VTSVTCPGPAGTRPASAWPAARHAGPRPLPAVADGAPGIGRAGIHGTTPVTV